MIPIDPEAKLKRINPISDMLREGVQGMDCTFDIKPEDMGKIEVWPYRIGYLTPDMTEEAKIKIKESEEAKQKGLEELRRLIQNEKKLFTPTDDNFLLMFLRARKYNTKNAFKLLQNFWGFRTEYQRIFDTVDPTSVRQIIFRDYLGFLPGRDINGSIVVICKIGMWEPEIDTVEQLIRCMSSLMYHAADDPATQVAGFTGIFDTRGVSWKHMKMCTLPNVLLLLRSTQNCFPGRYKTIHLISENNLFNIGWPMVYPLLPKKIKKRIIVHRNEVSTLKNYVHPSVLPSELGGDAGPFQNHFWLKVMDKDEPKMFKLLNYGYKK